VLVDRLGGDGDDVLALPEADEMERLEGGDDVLGLDARARRNVADGEIALVRAELV
jgi:hypothetical protein